MLRWRAGTAAAVAGLGAVGLLSVVTGMAAQSPRTATWSAAVTSSRGSNAAMTHSPRLLHQLAGSMTPDAGTAPPGPIGVDVASFQHANGAAIDWGRVAAGGYRFAAIKAAEGDYYTNPYYASDIAAARQAGLFVTAYDFGIPDSTSGGSVTASGTEKADYFLAAINGSYQADGKSLPLEMDMEYDPYGSECYGLTPAQIVSWITAFSNETLAKTGQLPMIYTTADWWHTCTAGSTVFSADRLWVAEYGAASPTLPAGWPTWTFWQYTSTGSVPGITGNVDVSYFNGAVTGNQAGAVGAPVWRQTHSLAAASGQTLSYSASGLPAGLSINRGTGLISGWLTTDGTSGVKVTATGNLGAADVTSFTWSVSAAPNAGPAGPVVLAGGGRCLDDPGYRIANGTRVDIWSCTGGGNQRWTMAQDRTVRVYGRCLSVYKSGTANGAAVVLHSCDGSRVQQWRIGPHGHLVNQASGRCLNDPGYRTANGTRLDIWSCGSGTKQRWTTPAGPIVSRIAPLCADDAAGSTANGNPIDARPCSGGTRQAWTVEPDGTVRVYGKCLDVYHSGTANGTAVDLHGCNGSGGQQWVPLADGTLLNPRSGRCLDIPGDSARSGTRLVISNCGASAGEDWRPR